MKNKLLISLFLMLSISTNVFAETEQNLGIRQRFAHQTSHFCERVLVGFEKHVPEPLKKPLRFLGYTVFPVIPLAKVLSNSDKTFFVFIESPLMGLINTPTSVMLASILNGHGMHFDSAFMSDTAELYKSYQGANLIRNGIAIDNSISANARSWLNWWYSTAIYAWQTAGDKLAMAHNTQQYAHAWSLIAYSALWPVFSQRVSQYVLTPLLFSKFPKESLLNKIHDTKLTQEKLVEDQNKAILVAKEKLAKVLEEHPTNKVEIGRAKDDLEAAEYGLKWIHWYRKGTEDGQGISKSKDAQYWGIKTGASTGAAIAMVTIYFLARWNLVGRTDQDDGIIKNMVRYMMEMASKHKENKVSEREVDEAAKQVVALLEEYKNQEVFPPLFPEAAN